MKMPLANLQSSFPTWQTDSMGGAKG